MRAVGFERKKCQQGAFFVGPEGGDRLTCEGDL
jgi:hypothetical protein